MESGGSQDYRPTGPFRPGQGWPWNRQGGGARSPTVLVWLPHQLASMKPLHRVSVGNPWSRKVNSILQMNKQAQRLLFKVTQLGNS